MRVVALVLLGLNLILGLWLATRFAPPPPPDGPLPVPGAPHLLQLLDEEGAAPPPQDRSQGRPG